MTFEEFVLLYIRQVADACNQGQRQGQYAVNLLSDIRLDIADRIINERLWNADPFNEDANLPTFWTKVEEMWEN